MYSNGEIANFIQVFDDTTYEVVVSAGGLPGDGIFPLMALRADYKTAGTLTVNTNYWADYRYTVALAPGVHRIALAYLNDGNSVSRAFLGLPEAAPVVCFSGLDVLIDLPMAVHAFERLRASEPETRLLLVGPTVADARAMLQDPANLEHVLATGPVPYRDLPKYLAAADVFLMPYADKVSNVGRWPNKVGDYMCVGRPVISNPIGEAKWLYEHYDIGVLCPPTADAMADAALALLRDPARAEQYGRRAREVAETVFRWDLLIADLERWYGERISAERG